jgi:hypothetical protein
VATLIVVAAAVAEIAAVAAFVSVAAVEVGVVLWAMSSGLVYAAYLLLAEDWWDLLAED